MHNNMPGRGVLLNVLTAPVTFFGHENSRLPWNAAGESRAGLVADPVDVDQFADRQVQGCSSDLFLV